VIKSFCRYTAVEQPGHLDQVTQILAIRQKNTPAPQLGHLTGDEVKALLAEPGTASPRAVRDTVLFSVVSRWISTAISALTGGLPVRCGWVHLRVTRRRCQQDGARGDQPVHPQPWRQQPDQRGEDRPVGPVEPGPRMGVRRSTATSCR
jgi:hypothetical protein